MKFKFENFSCDVQIFKDNEDMIMRFYDKNLEHKEKDICDYVLADPGFGFLCLKKKGQDGLLTGFLDNKIFSNNNIVDAAIEFLEKTAKADGYIPHQVLRVKTVKINEYNGEF